MSTILGAIQIDTKPNRNISSSDAIAEASSGDTSALHVHLEALSALKSLLQTYLELRLGTSLNC